MTNEKRCTEEQKIAAKNYFHSKRGTIVSEKEKKSGNYFYYVKINGRTQMHKISDDRLWFWLDWNWQPIAAAELPRKRLEQSRLDEMRKAVFKHFDETEKTK